MRECGEGASRSPPPPDKSVCACDYSAAATMLTTLRPPFWPNSTAPGCECEQRVVAATADVGAGVEVRAALADDDLAGEDLLAAEALHAQSLSVGVTTVAGGACALFVCHLCVSSWTT